MNDFARDHVFATVVEDTFLGREVPDFAAVVVARLDGEVPAPTAPPIDAPRGRLLRLGVLAACAAVLVLTVLLVLNRPADLPAGVFAGPDSIAEATPEGVHLERGWTASLDHGGDVLVADHTVTGARFIVSTGEVPNNESRDAIATWLRQADSNLTEQEYTMIKNPNRWLARGAVALCVLAGSVYIDGNLVRADEVQKYDEVQKEEPAKAGGHYAVTDVESAGKVPANASSITIATTDRADEVLAALAGVKAPRRVILDRCHGLTVEGAKRIASWTSLEQVMMSATPGFDDDCAAALTPLVNLTQLQLVDCPEFDGRGLQGLTALPLTEFSIEGSPKFGDAGLKAAASMKTLETLVLVGPVTVSSAGFAPLKDSKVTRLFLRKMPSLGVAEFAVIAQMSALEFLTVDSNSGVTNDAVEQLAGHAKLKGLYLNSTGVSDGIGYILGRLPALNSVALGHTSVSSVDITDIVGLKRVGSLTLAYCDGVTDEVLASLAAPGGPGYLDISGCKNITDKGVMGLETATKLQTLRVVGADQISDAACAYLEKKLPDCKIER